jgi:hypothetical protein
MPSVMKHTPFNPVSSVLLVLKKGLHTIHIWDDDNIFRKSVVQCPRAFPRVCPSPRARLGQLLSLWSLPARPRFCFVFFFSVKCHIQQLEKAVSILNIKKNEKCNKYPVLFNLPSQKKKWDKKDFAFWLSSIYSQIIFRNKTKKKNLPPFYE